MTEITGRTSKGGLKTWLFRGTGLARVESESFSAEEMAAENGNAYLFHGVCRTATAATGVLMYIKNTFTDKDLVVGRIFIDPRTLTDADMLINILINPTTVTAGTDTTTTGVVQKNSGKVNALAVAGTTLKVSDASSDMTFTGGVESHSIPIVSRTTLPRDLGDTNVIGPGQEWVIAFALEDGSATVTDQIISISVNAYIRDVDRE